MKVLPVELVCIYCLGCQMFSFLYLSFSIDVLYVMCLIKGAGASGNDKIPLCGTPRNVYDVVLNWNLKFTSPYLEKIQIVLSPFLISLQVE